MSSNSPVTNRLSREQLYERVWTLPSTKIAKEFGISDAGLAKVCKTYSVPKPPLGHWAKIQHGKPVERAPLPEEPKEWKRKVEIRGHIKESEEDFDAAIKASLIVARQRPSLVVAALPSSPLPIVARTMKSLRSAKVDDHGLVCPRAGSTLDVRVAPENIERAMSILQALLPEFEALELELSTEKNSMFITVHGERIGFSLVEESKREERPPTATEKRDPWLSERPLYCYKTTGRLSLRLHAGAPGSRESWTDGKRQRIENILGKFIMTSLVVADGIKKRRADDEARETQRSAWEALRGQKLKEIAEEEKRIEVFESQARQWHEAQRLRAYIEALTRLAKAEDFKALNDVPTQEYLAWAQNYADDVDPLTGAMPTVLDEKEEWSRYRFW